MSTEPYYKPWISDEEPKVPENWGLDGYRGRVPLTCTKCHEHLELRDQYLYSFKLGGTPYVILHNTEECTCDLRS